MWCGEYGKFANKPQAAPIKTYVDYELDKETDEPATRVDPITSILELFNNIGQGEYAWMQIIMRAHAKEDWFGMYKFADAFTQQAHEYIKKKVAGAAKRAKEIVVEELKIEDKTQQAQATARMTMLTEEEKEEIKAIERNMGKLVYECGVRAVYIAKKEKFKGITGAFLFRLFDAYKGQFNRLFGILGRGMIGFDYPWEDPLGFRRTRLKNLFYFHSKHRAFFYVPYDQKPEFLSTEELASLWHFPNTGVKTPGLNRVAARVGEPPSNIPGLPT